MRGKHRSGRGWRRVGIAGLLLAAGCAGGPEEGDAAAPAPDGEAVAAPPVEPGAAEAPAPPSAAPPAAGEGTEDTADADTTVAEWTAGIVDRRRPALRMTTLEEVRTGRHPGFDRVVFQFSGGEVPGYHLEYVDRPVRQCGSGDAVEVAGDGWLAVRLEPSQAHDEQGRATVQNRERALDLPVLRELQSICDFEGQVEWVLGVASPNRYRVLELRDPARLVVDVRH